MRRMVDDPFSVNIASLVGSAAPAGLQALRHSAKLAYVLRLSGGAAVVLLQKLRGTDADHLEFQDFFPVWVMYGSHFHDSYPEALPVHVILGPVLLLQLWGPACMSLNLVNLRFVHSHAFPLAVQLCG